MARQDVWTVLKAATTSWMFTSIPYEVAQLLGCTEDVIGKLPHHLRTLAFLNRGPGRLRIVPTYNSSELLQRDMYDVVGICQINAHLAIRITEPVAKHLELEIHRRENRGAESPDPVAFVVPQGEYHAFTEIARTGAKYAPAEVGHVYLTKPIIKGKWVWPSVDELENSVRSKTVSQAASVRQGR